MLSHYQALEQQQHLYFTHLLQNIIEDKQEQIEIFIGYWLPEITMKLKMPGIQIKRDEVIRQRNAPYITSNSFLKL